MRRRTSSSARRSVLVAVLAAAFPLAAAAAVQQTEAGTPGRAAAAEAGPEPAAQAPADPELDALAARVADQLRCPICRNQSVLESSSELARRMQSVIRERLAAGDSPEEVEAYFVARYGEWILLEPPARGINLLVYLLPAALVLAGGLFLGSRLRAWRARRQETPDGGESGLSEGDEAWLNEAIRSR